MFSKIPTSRQHPIADRDMLCPNCNKPIRKGQACKQNATWPGFDKRSPNEQYQAPIWRPVLQHMVCY